MGKLSIDLGAVLGHFGQKSADKKRFSFIEEQAKLDRDFQDEQRRRALDDSILKAREDALIATQQEYEAHELKLQAQEQQNRYQQEQSEQEAIFKFMGENNIPPTEYERVRDIMLERQMTVHGAEAGSKVATSNTAEATSLLGEHRANAELQALIDDPELLNEVIRSSYQQQTLLPALQPGQGLLRMGGSGDVTAIAENVAPAPESRAELLNAARGLPTAASRSGLNVLQPQAGELNIEGLSIPRKGREGLPTTPAPGFETAPPPPTKQPAFPTRTFPIDAGISPGDWRQPRQKPVPSLGELLQEEILRSLGGRRW